MPKFISDEKRRDILYHKNNGESNKDIAKWLLIGVRSVERVLKMQKETGTIENKIGNCGRKSVISEEQEIKIIYEIKKTPDITLLELIEKLNLQITEGGLSNYLKKRGYSFKKRQHIQQNKTDPMFKKNEELS